MSVGAFGLVTAKPGVQFTVIAPAGFRLLHAIEHTARTLQIDVTITSACDGDHSGPDDPHHRGLAYDVRTHDLTAPQKAALLEGILDQCRDDDEGPTLPVQGVPQSLSSRCFFGFIEAPGTLDEHIHVQLRKGRVYPALTPATAPR